MKIKFNPTFTLTDEEDDVLSNAFSVLNDLALDMRSHEIPSIDGLMLKDIDTAIEVLYKVVEIGDE